MTKFCNQCAREHGFDTGDFAKQITLEECLEGKLAAVNCTGCGLCFVDFRGICVGPCNNIRHYRNTKSYLRLMRRLKSKVLTKTRENLTNSQIERLQTTLNSQLKNNPKGNIHITRLFAMRILSLCEQAKTKEPNKGEPEPEEAKS